jgi:hypothetical protein
MAVFISVVLLLILLIVGLFVFTILQPKFVSLFDTLAPKYIPCVAVSASIDGGITYSEPNLKRIPKGENFFLKFDVSIRRRGLYWGDEKFVFTFENKEPGKLEAREPVEYSDKKTDSTGNNPTEGDTFEIFVSRYRGKNTVIYRCKPPKNCPPDTLFQITIKSDDTKLEPLNKTIALVFVSEQPKVDEAESAAAKVSIDGTVTVKIEKQGKNGKADSP